MANQIRAAIVKPPEKFPGERDRLQQLTNSLSEFSSWEFRVNLKSRKAASLQSRLSNCFGRQLKFDASLPMLGKHRLLFLIFDHKTSSKDQAFQEVQGICQEISPRWRIHYAQLRDPTAIGIRAEAKRPDIKLVGLTNAKVTYGPKSDPLPREEVSSGNLF